MERFRKLYEHHPRALMIAVNGEVIAMRDVSSATSELKVQAPLERSLGMIDVLSEQGITLLTQYVPAGPPEAPPEVRHEIILSEDRKLDLLVSFTSAGAVIELHYKRPALSVPTSSRRPGGACRRRLGGQVATAARARRRRKAPPFLVEVALRLVCQSSYA